MSALLPPYPTIRRELLRGDVIPFLGSGASLTARTPGNAPWRRLLDAGLDEWEVSYLPTARELAAFLAEEATFPDGEPIELAKVAQYFNRVIGPRLLYQRLHEIFNRDHPYTSLHTYLAKITKPLLIVTTNYDDLIERALKDEGRAFDLVVHTTDPSLGDELLWWRNGAAEPEKVLAKNLDVELSETTVIYKMHGAVDRQQKQRGQYVITEDDYIDFLERMTASKAIPTIFAEPFQTRPFLFLGYGLYDWNLRVVINRIEKQFRRPNDIVSWAIQREVKPLEQKLWEKRGVEVFQQDIDTFVARMQLPVAPPGVANPAADGPPAGAAGDAPQAAAEEQSNDG